ncbi:toll-like receptor 6 isoform X1 [Acropora millepora]|uniref:toll-like receptor 6 isoform X1 n=2 Tax=Acropora millepora TaxID=45264 RepID=UPI0010FCBEB4|nr:toll-like receptor 6 isoform X1 [Acropora millepora]XP_029184125.1 toll-like receptor 6 isoform X1 [Acropora millepora]XP_029184133.1 toll-like receptor 6 isoform X1 [Acropora millepora]XP_029184139.1 toll-like receptor 6 isoform X1 [Acropora millepora]XP_029184143.1 toll-like receptor 6 isoform X1 [Acropora millepora]XP_029184148.1 toll-like receptor 6 isoform X1 [Acropora millepora]
MKTCLLFCCFMEALFSVDAVQGLCSSGPTEFTKGKSGRIDCDFKNFAMQNVLWYKGKKLLTNGSQGLRQVSRQVSVDTFRSSLLFPILRFDHAGFYTCKQEPAPPNSRCPNGKIREIFVTCGSKGVLEAADKRVVVKKFSNATLKCSGMSGQYCFIEPVLTWHYRNKSIIKSNDKYTVRERKRKCPSSYEKEVDFFLEISNVTEADSGVYQCQMKCHLRNLSDSIQVTSYFEPGLGKEKEEITATTAQQQLTSPSGSQVERQWLVPAVCAAVLFVILAVVFALKKRIFLRKRPFQGKSREDVLNNTLFISYSSKDFSWVTENVISLLEKHSIPYSIHNRDFELGRPIVQNMADSVYNSRQVLIVLSNNYLASNFCREELQMALQRGLDTGYSAVTLVTIEKLKKSQLPSALRDKNFLDFEKHQKKQDWERTLLGVVL